MIHPRISAAGWGCLSGQRPSERAASNNRNATDIGAENSPVNSPPGLENAPRLWSRHQGDPIVSANLCGALLKMWPAQEDGILEFIPSWASSTPLGAAEGLLPWSVTFSSDESEAVADVYRQLRPSEGAEAKPWIADVDELRGTESLDGTPEGEVVFTLFDDDELVRARASLSREQYQIAYEVHRPRRRRRAAERLGCPAHQAGMRGHP